MDNINLTKERCMRLADMEGDETIAAGANEGLMPVDQRRLVLDLPADRQETLRAYAEGCYDRGVRIGLLVRPIARPQWVANCMQDALDHIGTTETWERIESVVSLQND